MPLAIVCRHSCLSNEILNHWNEFHYFFFIKDGEQNWLPWLIFCTWYFYLAENFTTGAPQKAIISFILNLFVDYNLTYHKTVVPAATSDRQIKLFIIVEKQFIAVFWSWGGVAERCSANPLIRRFHPKTNCDCLEAWHAAFDYIVTCPFAGKLQSVVFCCWKNNSVKRTSLRLFDKTANSVLHLMTNTLPGLTKNEIREEKILIGKVYYYAEVIVPWVPEVFFSSTDSKNLYLDFPESTTSERSPEPEKRALRLIS